MTFPDSLNSEEDIVFFVDFYDSSLAPGQNGNFSAPKGPHRHTSKTDKFIGDILGLKGTLTWVLVKLEFAYIFIESRVLAMSLFDENHFQLI